MMKDWVLEDVPSEKMMEKGRAALTNSEILSIVIGSAGKGSDALELAKAILKRFNNNLSELFQCHVQDLMKFPGIGKFKAAQIIAVFELCKRYNQDMPTYREKISSSRDSYAIAKNHVGDKPYEEFWIIIMNRTNRVLNIVRISEGGISGTVVDPKKIFKIALDNHASSLILFHNHPSGVTTPSEADLRITKKIKNAGEMLEITVLDHLIIGDNAFYSFADEDSL